MTEMELYKIVKAAIFATPPCPDGWLARPCRSCEAASIVKALQDAGAVQMSDPSGIL